MNPAWWLLGGIAAAASLLATGWAARGKVSAARLALLEAERDGIATQLREVLDREGRHAEAAQIVLDARERASSAARESDPVRRRLRLLGVDPDEPAPSAPGREAERSDA